MRILVFLVLFLCGAAPAFAQNWTFDARKIAIGNVGGTDNPASRMIDEQRDYRAIVLPFGLIQVLRDLDVFKPGSEKFDIIRSVEYAAAPLHYVIGRDSSSNTGRQFVVDVRNGSLSRDLNAYRGFVPANQPPAEGLAFSSNGRTIKLYRGRGGSFQGLFVGAGQYLAMRTTVDLDQRLIDILGSKTNVYIPNTQFRLATGTRGELALALTGGYRGRFALPANLEAPSGGSGRDGVYVAFNYDYLYGFRYEDVNTTLRLDTDAAGLLTINPTFAASPPVVIARNHGSSGRGFALDAGVGVVIGGIEAGFGVSGIANRIDWTGVERTTYSLANVFLGNGTFADSLPRPVSDVRVELPLDYRANAGYRGSRWSALGEFGHGFQGTSFHGGYEYRLSAIELRGGALYTREQWQPTGGIGLNMGPRVSIDMAMFGTSANVERKRHPAIAASLRFNRRDVP